jgi:hypothetical protein
MCGGGTIKYRITSIGICLLVVLCIFAITDESSADGDYVTVGGQVSVPDAINESDYSGKLDKLLVMFVSDDHFSIGKVVDGHYSVQLKDGARYTVKCFNNVVDTAGNCAFDGDEMSYIYCSDVVISGANSNLNITLDKGKPYTDTTGNDYYYYETLGIATLVKLNVGYDSELIIVPATEGVELYPGSGAIGRWRVPPSPEQQYNTYTVTSGQEIIVPSTINGNYKVTFVGTGMANVSSIIEPPESDRYNKQTDRLNVYQSESTSDLAIIFEGSVYLNSMPFSAPFGSQYMPTTIMDKYRFDITFKDDVYLNSYAASNNNRYYIECAKQPLEAIKNVSIEGVYHGVMVIEALDDSLMSGTVMNTACGSVSTFGYMGNTNFSAITFSDTLTIKANDLDNSSIGVLGVLPGSEFTVEPNENAGYAIKIGESVIFSGVSAVTSTPEEIKTVSNPITLRKVCGDSVTYSLAEKNNTKVLGNLSDSQNMRFAGWYKDSGFTVPYDSTEILRADVSVYARFIPVGEEQILFTVVDGGTRISEVLDKGDSKPVVGPVSVPQNMRFDDWYIDAEYKTKYVAEALTVDTTVYVRYVIDSYTVKFSEGVESISSLHAGDVISLVSVSKDGNEFNGWMVNDLLLGAQYIVSARDADESGNILLTASFSEKADAVKTSWTLTVTLGSGAEGKVFWTTTNALGSYGMITVLPGEFEKVSYSAVSTNGSCAPISDNCALVFSADGNDVSVTVSISEPVKASEYEVSVAEIASGEKHGFKATVTAKDGYVDSAGAFAISYVYKTWNDTDKVWIYTTSGVTENVSNFTVAIPTDKKVSSVTGEFLLDNDDARLVFGYATFSFKGTSATGTVEDVIVHSPVIMCVSEIQAVVGKP